MRNVGVHVPSRRVTGLVPGNAAGQTVTSPDSPNATNQIDIAVRRGMNGGKIMKIINLTPHTITFFDGTGKKVLTVEPSGQVARCVTSRVQVDTITVNGISVPVNQTRFWEVFDLPDPQPDTIYIVSAIVAQAVPDRKDVFIVDDAVRDDQGRIIGVRALAHV